MKVWVTGSGGMLARAVKILLAHNNIEYVGTDAEVDIGNAERVHEFVAAQQPSHIINCAADTRVDNAETDATTAYHVNAIGAGNLARAASEIAAHFVHFSTDYVFDGKGRQPYVEDAACAPQSAYARSKLRGDELVLTTMPQASNPRHTYIIRTSWLFGEGGNNFVATMVRLMKERENLRIVHDQVGRPTCTFDLAEAALVLAGMARNKVSCPSGIYHFANAGVASWYEFATEILAMGLRLGLPLVTQHIEPITTAEYTLPATRPAYSVLSTEKYEACTGRVPRCWHEALDDYLRALKELK